MPAALALLGGRTKAYVSTWVGWPWRDFYGLLVVATNIVQTHLTKLRGAYDEHNHQSGSCSHYLEH